VALQVVIITLAQSTRAQAFVPDWKKALVASLLATAPQYHKDGITATHAIIRLTITSVAILVYTANVVVILAIVRVLVAPFARWIVNIVIPLVLPLQVNLRIKIRA
jgi:hypothetical protein